MTGGELVRARAYAYNAGRRYTKLRARSTQRQQDASTRAKRDEDGRALVYDKACRRFVRSVNARLRSKVGRELAVLWSDRRG